MFCQQLSKAIIKETQSTLIEAMAGWLNERGAWGVGRGTRRSRGERYSRQGRASGGKGAVAEDAEGGGGG